LVEWFQKFVYPVYTLQKELVMLTRVFKSGNSLAVRIPKELAIADASQVVEIERVGNTLVMRPVVQESLAGLIEICAQFTPDFMAGGRDQSPEMVREWEESVLTTMPTPGLAK
jgi:antitoxin VapB